MRKLRVYLLMTFVIFAGVIQGGITPNRAVGADWDYMLQSSVDALPAGGGGSHESQMTVDISTPQDGSSVSGPVHFKATAATICSEGITMMAISSSQRHVAYVIHGDSLDTWLNLEPNIYNVTLQAWDKCGNSAQSPLTITVTSADAAIPKPGLDPGSGSSSSVQSSTTVTTSTPTSCGPPNYCSRTDTKVVPYPSPLPNFGRLVGTNTVAKDPNFNNSVLRFTDATLQPSFPNRSYNTGLGGSGDKNVWNSDSTILLVSDTYGRYFPVKFDPLNFRQLGPLYGRHPIFVSGPGVFSHVNPNHFFAFNNGKVRLLDYTNRTAPPTGKLIYDFSNCGIPAQVTWQSTAGVDTTETTFGVAYSTTGTQGTGIHVVAYNSALKNCSHLNTSTGVVTLWPSGKVIGNISTTADRFTIHNVVLKGGLWMVMTRQVLLSSAPSPGAAYAWQMGTTVLNHLVPQSTGHWAAGCGRWINSPGMVGAYYVARHYSDPSLYSRLWTVPMNSCNTTGAPSCTAPFDSHPATYGGCADNTPLCTSTVAPSTHISWPYQNEIVCFSSDGSNQAWRFAHTYSYPSNNFNAAWSIGALSQDGRFYAWTTNNGGAFGCANGTMNCTVRNRRSDVLIVKLR
jgi:hypothetical protein